MPDFLDRFHDQLCAAQPVAPRRLSGTFIGRHRVAKRRIGRRGLVGAGLVLVVLAPVSLGVVGAWEPQLARPGIDDPGGTGRTPVSPAVVDILGVLRRPQTAADRTGTAPLITAIGARNQIDGAHTDAIRMVASGFALAPVRSVVDGPTTTSPDQLCLTNGSVVACAAATSVASNGLAMLTASATATKLRGIVPDRGARVLFSPNAGKPVEAAVASNVYEIVTPEVQLAAPREAPDGFSGPPTTPPAPAPLPVAAR